MPEFEAIGDAVTGGVLGRAVEPKAGETADGHTHEKNCLNCGCELIGDFCHCCGQRARVHRTLSAFFHDFLHGVLHFEGKIWRTLPMLAWRPGELTRRYIDGQRARFISPIALFLFTVFLMFAVMGLTGALDETARSASAQEDIAGEVADARESVRQLEAERAAVANAGGSTAKIDSKLSEARTELRVIETAGSVQTGAVGMNTFATSEDVPGWLRRAVGKASANPELLFYKLKTNAYKFSWALIPISVPFVWLLFPFSRRFRMYDHTVFVTFSLCFMMLLLVVGSTVELVAPVIASFFWFIPPIHLYRQLRGTYAVSRLGAIWRTIALVLFAWIAIGLFASLLVAIGAF
jgi:hypothetical protein